jgi:Protein of unknown function (DUF2752)
MRSRLASACRRLQPAGPVLAIAALLALIPHPTCIVRLTVGQPCPACGLTRAGLSLLRLDFAAATHFHPLALPLALATVAAVVCALFLEDAAWKTFVKYTLGGSGVALIAVWVARFAGFFGGPVP